MKTEEDKVCCVTTFCFILPVDVFISPSRKVYERVKVNLSLYLTKHHAVKT